MLGVLDAGNSDGADTGAGGAGEMLRNELLLLLPHLTNANPDLQKIVAFSGAFERLLRVVDQEGGVEGGIVVQDALNGMVELLRYNVSNQVSIKAAQPETRFLLIMCHLLQIQELLS